MRPVNWTAVTALAAVAAVAVALLDWALPNPSIGLVRQDQPIRADPPPPPAPDLPEPVRYTEWRPKESAFAATPARVPTCSDTPGIRVENDPQTRRVRIDGEVRMLPYDLSDTCRLRDVRLTAPLVWNSGGRLHLEYRSEK